MLWWTLRQLKSKDNRKRIQAVERLGKSKDARAAVEALASALNDEDLGVRKAAAKALGEVNDERAAQALIAALGEYRFLEAEAEVVDALSKIGGPAVGPLVIALKENTDTMRVGEALSKIVDKRAIEPLVAILKDIDSPVRWAAVTALGNIGDERAVEPIVAALIDKNSNLVMYAPEALVKIGSQKAVEPLVAALKDNDGYVRRAVAEALEGLGWKPTNDAQRAWLAANLGEWDKAASVKGAAVEPLVAALKDVTLYGREGAIQALGEIGDKRAVEPLLEALNDENNEVRKAAEEGLERIAKIEEILPKTEYGRILYEEFDGLLDDNSYQVRFENTPEIQEINELAFGRSTRKRAILRFNELKGKYPQCAEVYNLLAQAHKFDEELGVAERILKEAYPLVARKSVIADGLGQLYLNQFKSLDNAIKWYARSWIAQRNSPKLWGTYLRLAHIYNNLGEKEIFARLKAIADEIYGAEGVSLTPDGEWELYKMMVQITALRGTFLMELAARMSHCQKGVEPEQEVASGMNPALNGGRRAGLNRTGNSW